MSAAHGMFVNAVRNPLFACPGLTDDQDSARVTRDTLYHVHKSAHHFARHDEGRQIGRIVQCAGCSHSLRRLKGAACFYGRARLVANTTYVRVTPEKGHAADKQGCGGGCKCGGDAGLA